MFCFAFAAVCYRNLTWFDFKIRFSSQVTKKKNISITFNCFLFVNYICYLRCFVLFFFHDPNHHPSLSMMNNDIVFFSYLNSWFLRIFFEKKPMPKTYLGTHTHTQTPTHLISLCFSEKKILYQTSY